MIARTLAGVDLILGVNGMIWVTYVGYIEAKEEDRRQPSREQLEAIVRAANAIRALVKLKFPVTASRVSTISQVSISLCIRLSLMQNVFAALPNLQKQNVWDYGCGLRHGCFMGIFSMHIPYSPRDFSLHS